MEEIECVNIDHINTLRLQGKYEEADLKLKNFQETSGSMRVNRLNGNLKIKKPKTRNVSLTVTLPIKDVLFIDEKELKPSELLKDKIQEIRNG